MVYNNIYPNNENRYSSAFSDFYKERNKNNFTAQPKRSLNTGAAEVMPSKTQSGTLKKILAGAAAAGATVLAAVYGVKKFKVTNIKNIQKTFQEVFMRDDLTVEQTREMLRHYKEIEKIKDRNEYAKALFEEVKKNFGMENSNIKLVFEKKKGAAGFCCRDNSAISITPDCSKRQMLNTMHHEFRHAKQHELVYNQYPEIAGTIIGPETKAEVLEVADKYVDKMITLKNGHIILDGKEFSSTNDGIEYLRKAKFAPIARKHIKKNIGNLNPDNVPEKYRDFTQKLKEGLEGYTDMNTDFNKYWNNFTEQDARIAGHKMNKYIKGHAFEPIKDSWFGMLYYSTWSDIKSLCSEFKTLWSECQKDRKNGFVEAKARMKQQAG